MPSTSASETLRSATAGLSAQLIHQVAARIISFLVKSIAIRALRPAHFAYVEIRLTLIVNLALLPALHGFRPVALRAPTENRAAALTLFNGILSCFLGIALGFVCVLLDPENTFPLIVATLAVIVRTFAELPVIFTRRRQRYSQASQARAACVVISSFIQTIAVSLVPHQSLAPGASSLSHLAYTIALAVTMRMALGSESVPPVSLSLMRRDLRREDLLMSAVTTVDGLIKFFLENGEGIILDVCCAPVVKGAYKLASNFGSVLARFFSEALEEQSFNVFSRLAPAFRPDANAKDAQLSNNTQAKSMRNTCIDTLVLGLKAALSFSLLFSVIGPCFSYAALRLIYGSTWADDTEACTLLSRYFLYLLFMAANGVSEAFVSASASTSELKRRTKFSTYLSIVYMTSMYFAAIRFGPLGIIAMNSLNMTARTIYSAWFFGYLTGLPVSKLLEACPSLGLVLSLFAARILARTSEFHFFGPPGHRFPIEGGRELVIKVCKHGLSGVVSLIIFGVAFVVFERGFIKKVRSLHAHKD